MTQIIKQLVAVRTEQERILAERRNELEYEILMEKVRQSKLGYQIKTVMVAGLKRFRDADEAYDFFERN